MALYRSEEHIQLARWRKSVKHGYEEAEPLLLKAR
jgi:hypothetical protein